MDGLVSFNILIFKISDKKIIYVYWYCLFIKNYFYLVIINMCCFFSVLKMFINRYYKYIVYLLWNLFFINILVILIILEK